MASKPKTVPPAETAVPAKEDAAALLCDLENLIDRAEHFENAGQIHKLRQDGKAIIERIRTAL